MNRYEPLNILPVDIQSQWLAGLSRTAMSPAAKGHFYLVDIRPTRAGTYQEQRILVHVVDENGFPIANIPVAFSFSTANQFLLTSDFLWSPPPPYLAKIVVTDGAGQSDMIQGSPVKQGQPGGMAVYLLEPEYSSDVVTGAGMLADHTGLYLTFQLRRPGVLPLQEQIKVINERLGKLENANA